MGLVLINITDLDEYMRMYRSLMKLHIDAMKKIGLSSKKAEEHYDSGGIKQLNNPDRQVKMIINSNGDILGFIEYEESKYGVYVHRLFIKEQYRRKGYGTEVVNMLQEKYENIELKCYNTLEAHKFYEKLGFKPIYIGYRK